MRRVAVDPVRSVSRDVHEHEAFLSFADDRDSVAFQDWFWAVGLKQFEAWLTVKRDAEAAEEIEAK